jgi:hypothetical protein
MITENKMHYDRKLSETFSQLIEPKGKLRWLFDFVKEQKDLDFLIGKNEGEEWISIYRGLSRLIKISKCKTSDALIKIDGADTYKSMMPDLYGKQISIDKNFGYLLSVLLEEVRKNNKFDRYYNNKKEGYYQNELSRKYGIDGNANSDFVIVDKEAVIGYENQEEKKKLFGKFQEKYKELQKEISVINAERYGKSLEKKSIGNELDFIAVDKSGNILLIEYKHGTNTSGIYLSPLQIGLYYDIFTTFDNEKFKDAVLSQLKQKQAIGLINANWNIPKKLHDIIPVLIISDYNVKSSAKKKYDEIMDICRKRIDENFLKDIKIYNYTSSNGLTTL